MRVEAAQPCEQDDSVGGAKLGAIEGVWIGGCRGCCERAGGAIEVIGSEECKASAVGGFERGLGVDREEIRKDVRAQGGAAVRDVCVGRIFGPMPVRLGAERAGLIAAQ